MSQEEICSITLNSNRIVGGKEAIPHSLPWQVAIFNVEIGMAACGGTILAPKFIMTAGHCTHRLEPSTYQVWAGAHDVTTFDGKGVGQSGHTIVMFHNNPNFRYHSDKGTYSLVLLHFFTRLPFSII